METAEPNSIRLDLEIYNFAGWI